MLARVSSFTAVVVLALASIATGGVDTIADAEASVGASKAKCTKKPFVGTVKRTAEDSATGQPAAERKTADIRSALVFDLGTDKNYTVYLSDYRLDPDDLGGTLAAPEGNLLTTVFLRSARGTPLRAGTKLVAGEDPVSIVIDAGAGARAVTSGPSGTLTILKTSKDRLCFAIAYRDDHQAVKGVVNASIP